MKTVCLDAGHGGYDSGVVCRGVEEKTITLKIVKRMRGMLRYTEADSVLTRVSDTYVSLRDRVKFANAQRADLFLSVHANADPDPDLPGMPEARGEEVWIYPGSVEGRRFATEIERAMLADFPDEPWRGIKERGLYVVKKTKMPAALVEVGFIDASISNRMLQDSLVQHRIALALVTAIIRTMED